MPDKHETVSVDWTFTPEEFGRIGMGDIPWEFGDRSFAFLEDNCLYIHEFLGRCLYIVWFEDKGDLYHAYQLRYNSFGTPAKLNNPDFHIRSARQYIDGSLIRGNTYNMLPDSDVTRNQIWEAIQDKEQPIPEKLMRTNTVYRSEYRRTDTGEKRDLRFIVKIDRYSNLYTEYYLIKGGACIRKRIDHTGKQTDLVAGELDQRLMEASDPV